MLLTDRFESFCRHLEKLRCIKDVACVVGEVNGYPKVYWLNFRMRCVDTAEIPCASLHFFGHWQVLTGCCYPMISESKNFVTSVINNLEFTGNGVLGERR